MLRLVLGSCGVGLIAFGVFGGQILDGMHRSISNIFTPETNVAETNNEAVNVNPPALQETVAEATTVAQPEDEKASLNKNSENDESMIVLASSEGSTDEGSPDPALETDTVIAASVPNAETTDKEPIAPQAVQPVAFKEESPAAIAADSLAIASKAVAKSPEVPAAENLKAEGVEVALKSTNGSPRDNTLFVLKERVNLREGPSTKHPIVLQLDQGQELMEFKRDGKWVHVGAYGTSGKIGWVHQTLVSPQ